MSVDGNDQEGSDKPKTTTIVDSIGGNYRSNRSLVESTDDSVSSSSTRTTIIDANPNYYTSSNDKKEWRKENSLLNIGCDFEELLEENGSILDVSNKSGKRSSDDTNIELPTDQSPRLRRPRRFSKASASTSTSSSSPDVKVSSLTKRLNQMTVKERQNAMYDLHGIPLEDEAYEIQMGVGANSIERDPQKIHRLLLEIDRLVEDRIQLSKTLHSGESMNSAHNHSDSAVLKDELRNKDFGKGLRLARQQNPEYVNAQRIKFLRADRYDADLAAGRMIRFFDTKRELFCSHGYNGNNDDDRNGCLGRDLRLSDFSKEDFEMWKNTGFFQLCGMRDRANRAIVVLFGRVLLEAKVPPALLLRTYLYVYNLWSRDESTQRAGVVAIGYIGFTDVSSPRPGGSPSSPSTKKEGIVGLEGGIADTKTDDEVIEQYLKQTYPLVSQIIKVGMSAQLRGACTHFCIDNPKLNAQFESLAENMPIKSAARFRCHYASVRNPESSILGASGSIKNGNDNSSKEDSVISDNDDEGDNMNRVGKDDAPRSNKSQQENDDGAAVDSDFNPHKELLYTLMTFGIPRETIPINDVTGETHLEFHHAILEAIEERENQDHLLEAAAANKAPGNNSLSGNKRSTSLASSTSSDKLWMSLTASTGSNTSFALFPNLLEGEELEDGSDHSTNSLFGSSPVEKTETLSKAVKPAPDLLSSLSSSSAPLTLSSIDNNRTLSKPVTANREIPRRAEAPPSNPAAPILVPTPNDIIMGRGPWNRNHPGNLRLKAMLERERDRYEYVNRFERMRIVDAMLNELYDDYGTRFLYKPKTKQSDARQSDGDAGAAKQAPIPTTGDAWLEAKRDKAHDKITHDFRNLRRQKQVSPKSNQVPSTNYSRYNM